MNTLSNRYTPDHMDSLDLHHQEFKQMICHIQSRSKSMSQSGPKDELAYKNFYKQSLDEVLNQKNQYKSLEKQKQQQERKQYNERLRMAQQAERIKDLSYKNYYQMIMNNQQNIKSKYISPFQERNNEKDKLINRGVEVGKVRSQMDFEREIRRQQNVKRQFQTVLSQQMNFKEEVSKKQQQERMRTNSYLKNVLLTPQEVEKLQREKKLTQKNKYKQDLDRLVSYNVSLSQSQFQNPELSTSRFNQKPLHHNILLNPLPFNIQNPYILKEMQKKNILATDPNSKTLTASNPYSTGKNNIF